MNQRLISLKLSTVLMLVSLACFGTWPVLAQSSPTNDPLQDLQLEDPNDPNQVFTNRGGTGSLLNLLNRLQQANGRSDSEFAEDQAENFNSAVDAFRKKQQQQLGNPGSEGANPIPETSP
ncbi:hypothetical protein [Acaryochloris sp. IP29b_bin.137]|uniref:hypothetical protein n=1 Tax=Acaryochloris sp. IP29b_bin.137 TaxID=2969217 RepID=UPI002618A674|nr:hypothetical protein [Acaryochloris sp. IP29b_bin.137]